MTAAPSRPPQARSDTSPALAVLRALFARLEAEDIRHCHWKSNEHVDRSLVGATDVDVLVDRAAMAPLTRILTELDFKRFVVKPGLGYPGIEDYVGFDQASGALTHVHVHFQLTLGEKFLKGHRLPWEELYLTTRVKDEALGLYLADPALELVVLVVRAAMKLRARDLVLAAVGKPYFRGGLLREFRWLAARVSPERVGELATRLLGAEAGRAISGGHCRGRSLPEPAEATAARLSAGLARVSALRPVGGEWTGAEFGSWPWCGGSCATGITAPRPGRPAPCRREES